MTIHIQPHAMPAGMDPTQWRAAIEERIEDLMNRTAALITALDGIDMDSDFELERGEPWLGWPEQGPQALAKDQCGDDREVDLADEGEGDDPDLEPLGDEADYSHPLLGSGCDEL